MNDVLMTGTHIEIIANEMT